MSGWREVPFGGRGEVTIEQGEFHLQMGAVLTGVAYTNPVPRMNYEIALEGKRVMGSVVGSIKDMRETLEVAAKHGIRPMVETHPFEDAQLALDRVREGKPRFRAVLKMV